MTANFKIKFCLGGVVISPFERGIEDERVRVPPRTDVMIFKIFSPKKFSENIGVFCSN
jgi:hypothetical protein